MENQHHAERSEGKTLDPCEHDVGRASDKKEDDENDWVQASPEVLHSLEVPEAQAVAQSDLLGEVGDLPVLVDIRIQPVASVFGIRDGKEVDETWQQGYEQQPEGPPAPECKGSGSGRGAATLPTVFLVVVREDPGQAQAPVSNERKLSLRLGRVFTKSLTTRADANLRVPLSQAAGRTAGRIRLPRLYRSEDLHKLGGETLGRTKLLALHDADESLELLLRGQNTKGFGEVRPCNAIAVCREVQGDRRRATVRRWRACRVDGRVVGKRGGCLSGRYGVRCRKVGAACHPYAWRQVFSSRHREVATGILDPEVFDLPSGNDASATIEGNVAVFDEVAGVWSGRCPSAWGRRDFIENVARRGWGALLTGEKAVQLQPDPGEGSSVECRSGGGAYGGTAQEQDRANHRDYYRSIELSHLARPPLTQLQ